MISHGKLLGLDILSGFLVRLRRFRLQLIKEKGYLIRDGMQLQGNEIAPNSGTIYSDGRVGKG
jgi:hypothetical protein